MNSMNKAIAFIGIFIFVFACQYARAENKNECKTGTINLNANDTLLPIIIVSSEKMNIMFDVQKELIALQWKGLNREDRSVILTDSTGKVYNQKQMYAGSTIVYFETQTLYEGNYVLKIWNQPDWIYNNIKIRKPE